MNRDEGFEPIRLRCEITPGEEIAAWFHDHLDMSMVGGCRHVTGPSRYRECEEWARTFQARFIVISPVKVED
jgi:hypothetical protein